MSSASAVRVSNPVKWTICIVASLGFLFDIYVVLIGPLIVQPAINELGGLKAGTPGYRFWAGTLFWIPPLVGGFCGLWGGYFADRFGRRRILVWSILLYAVSTVGAGLASSLPMLLLFRTTSFAGVCVEFVAALAWIAELFTSPSRREAMLGYTQAFSSLGGMLAAGSFYVASRFSESFPAIYGEHAAWRYVLISGLLPAIPLILIRPFLPESPEWESKRLAGTLKRPSVAELFRPRFRKTTLITALLFACAYGSAFGGLQQSPQIAGGLSQVAALPASARGQITSGVQAMQETGGLLGRVLAAGLALYILSRRRAFRLFLIPGLIIIPIVFVYAPAHSLQAFRIGIFCAGITTVAQLNFLGNYLPRVYPLHLRGTGEGFAANVGGRMLGTSAAFITQQVAAVMPGGSAGLKLGYAAAIVAFGTYAAALALSFWMPEPPPELPE